MDEQQTTTDATTQDTGAEVTAQPEEQHAEAVTTTDSEPQQPDKTTVAASEETQSDFADWLAKKGIDPSDPEALAKVTEMARNSERAMHTKAQTASELKKQLESSPGAQLDTDNELVQQLFGEVSAIKRAQDVDTFKAQVGLTNEQEQQMVAYLGEHPEKGQLYNAGYISLQELYSLSVGSHVDKEGLIKQGGQQALQQLANKQRATSIPGNATTQELAPKQEDAFLAGLMKG